MKTQHERFYILKSSIQEVVGKRTERAMCEFDVRETDEHEADRLHMTSRASRDMLEFHLSCTPGFSGRNWQMPIRDGIGPWFAAGTQYIKTSLSAIV